MISSEINIVNNSLCAFRFKQAMNKICLQDELLWSSKTFIKVFHVDKNRWIPKKGEQLEVFMEHDNPKNKFAACVKANKENCRTFKEKCHEKICRSNIFLSVE